MVSIFSTSIQHPAFRDVREEHRWVERHAKLFEAGEFPDKGVTVTEEHLRQLAAAHREPVPILIEHAESPLEIGFLTGVEVRGPELFGTVALTEEADRLIERSGARSLSVGLSPDLSEILEVSLVRSPRVESARLFCTELEPAARWDSRSSWRTRYERLESEVREREARAAVERFVRQGRLTPAQAPAALSLFLTSTSVTFDGRSVPVAEVLRDLLDKQPVSPLFREHAPEPPSDYSQQLLLPEEADFYRRHFPDVSLDEIARRKAG